MAIMRHGKDWNLPIYILASYISIGFAIIFLLPDGIEVRGLAEVAEQCRALAVSYEIAMCPIDNFLYGISFMSSKYSYRS